MQLRRARAFNDVYFTRAWRQAWKEERERKLERNSAVHASAEDSSMIIRASQVSLLLVPINC